MKLDSPGVQSSDLCGWCNWANTKSITLNKNIEENLPQALADSEKIIQVLNNLIGNDSVKFMVYLWRKEDECEWVKSKEMATFIVQMSRL